VGVPEKYLSYCGIRVTDLDRSLRFYTELFGLTEVARGDNSAIGRGVYVLLRDTWSGQQLELNWYPRGSDFAVPYLPGEGLDHIAFRVDDLPRCLDELQRAGVDGTSRSADHELPGGIRVAYVTDPDGNWLELYDHASGSIPRLPPSGY
jgi:lactoylglutathione lyase